MNDLRTALIVIGVLFVLGLGLWERRRSSRRARTMPLPESTAGMVSQSTRRVEPGISDYAAPGAPSKPDTLEVPIIHPVDPVRVDVMQEVAVDIPSAARREPPRPAEPVAAPPMMAPPVVAPPMVTAAIRWPPARTDRVLSLRVVRADGEPLPGRALRLGIESAGMVHGPQRIFHLVDDDGNVVASAANLVRPGSFDPDNMDQQDFRGLSLFSILPGHRSALEILEDLARVAREIATSAGAVVQDEQGAPLDAERLTQLRRSVQAYAEAASDSP